MVLALAALAAAAASFPTGFGFGAGYGAGVRIGYDVIYPKLAPFAAKITDDIIGQVGKLFGGDAGKIATQSGGTSGFKFSSQQPFSPDSPQITPKEPKRTLADVRLGGAGELKETVTSTIDKITSPFTATMTALFTRFKAAEITLQAAADRHNAPFQGATSKNRTLTLLRQAQTNMKKLFEEMKFRNWFKQYADWRSSN